MELAKESLVTKRRILESFTEKGLYPFSKFYLRNIKKGFGEYWKNHFSTIGIIGMNDALLNLNGSDITEPAGIEFSLRVMDFIRARLADFQEETGKIFNLEATPAEGASYSLARVDKARYPDLKVYNQVRNNGSVPYYTNSTQLPVGYTDDAFEALRLQDDLQTRYTGGTVVHCFLGEKLPSVASTWNLVKTIAGNFRLPYFTLTPTFSVCPDHGYLTGQQETCPECGAACEVWSRSVGYLRPVDQWHAGKQSEFRDRRTFDRQLREAGAREAGGAAPRAARQGDTVVVDGAARPEAVEELVGELHRGNGKTPKSAAGRRSAESPERISAHGTRVAP